MSLFGSIHIPGHPDPENIRKLDRLPIPQIRRIMQVGMPIDISYLRALSDEFEQGKTRLKSEICSMIPPDALEQFVGLYDDVFDINLDSSDQVGDLLFNALQLGRGKRLKMTKGGGRLSTGKKQLEVLKGEHPIVSKLLQYRELSKLKNTYTDKLPEVAVWHNAGTCLVCGRKHWDKHPRVHSEVLTTRADTGRLASKKPNLQNIPARTENGRKVRAAFIGSTGRVLISRDYAQIELRKLASAANEPNMIRIFKSNGDIHTDTAMRAFHITDPKLVDHLLHRAPCKNVNFGICLREGQQVLTNMGLVPIEKVTSDMLVWDGEEWVRNEGAVYKGYKKVIHWDGITGTPDHNVWLQNGKRVQLSEALAKRSKLAVTACQDTPIRFVGDKIGSPSIDRRRLFGVRHLPRMWEEQRGDFGEPLERTDSAVQMPERVYVSRPQGAGQEADGEISRHSTALLKPRKRILRKLRWEGNREQIPVGPGVCPLHIGKSTSPDLQGSGYCPDQQQRQLRAGEFALGEPWIQPTQHETKHLDALQRPEDHGDGLARGTETGLSKVRFERGTNQSVGQEGLGLEGNLTGPITEETEEWAHVYDIMNAGPRHRFTCEGKLVSNCYGLSAPGLYDLMYLTYAVAGMPIPDWLTMEWCEEFIQIWFGLYPVAKVYFDLQEYRALRYGFNWTPMGRVRLVPEVWSVHQRVVQAGIRQAGNHPIQGDAADTFKIGVSRVEKVFDSVRSSGKYVEALMLIHDELLTECDEDIAEDLNEQIGFEMERALDDEETGETMCRVPIKSDGKVMTRWKK